jgi:hypothetical protein
MIGTLLKMEAYKHAPRATFAALNPKKSARVAHMKYDLKHAYAPRLTAVGAALIAMPVGFLIGKMLTGRHNGHSKAAPQPAASRGTAGVSPVDPAIH